MIKLLYAAGNSHSSAIQLQRILSKIDTDRFEIKVAAYKKSSPISVKVDYTLDVLIGDPYGNRENISIYNDQIKRYRPDLIISDLEYYTSFIAYDLNIPYWNCNSNLIRPANLENTIGAVKYKSIYNRPSIKDDVKLKIILENSDFNFIYSHFCDISSPPRIKDNFKWVRPYYEIGSFSVPCEHDIFCVSPRSNKKLITLLKNNSDSVFFTERYYENYENIILKNISNIDEYRCNLFNSKLVLSDGNPSFLADAFYNKKFSVIYIDYSEHQNIASSFISEKYKLAKCVYNTSENIEKYYNKNVDIFTNENVSFLHEYLNEL